jgi:hypothetical protein
MNLTLYISNSTCVSADAKAFYSMLSIIQSTLKRVIYPPKVTPCIDDIFNKLQLMEILR